MPKSNPVPFELSDYALKAYFVQTAERQGWLKEAEIIAAVSGGGDSVALLWLCRKFFGGKVTAVHVNHGIRGSESDGDEIFTRDFAQSISADFVSVNVSVPSSREKGESLESAARRLRLESLCNAAKSLGVSAILLGHNKDDLAETVLFNLLRGTGIRGAVGMTESSELDGVRLYRPLLGLRREFLRDILRVRNISWREDSTNNDDNYTRNYIRLKLLPVIEENINSSAVEHLADFGQDMRIIREAEDRESERLFAECLVDSKPLSLSMKKLRRLDDQQKSLVIREAGRRLSLRTLARPRCVNLSELISRSGNFVFQWCNGVTLQAKSGRLIFEDNRQKS